MPCCAELCYVDDEVTADRASFLIFEASLVEL